MKQFILPELPYALDALAPHLSKEALEYHYGKHHAAYINNLNKLITGTDYENMPIEEIVKRADAAGLFNNAAQAYNHTFYWHCMKPNSGAVEPVPGNQIASAIGDSFGSLEKFKEEFTKTGLTHFGSGWAWLLMNKSGKLEIKGMHDADTPIKDGDRPLLALDVWEHAYYIDYRNARADYISAFWKLINWEFAEKQLLKDKSDTLMTASAQ